MADQTAQHAWGLEEDGDLCRVCRSEAEESKPLIYPCKCSGSVRYVHSDCLQEWLSHSQKRYCEICGHNYTLTKVYSTTLPSAIPVIVYVRQSALVAGRMAWTVFRVCIAILAWLVVLPCFTMFTMRLILVFADYVTYPAVAYGLRGVIADSHEELNATLSTNFTLPVNATSRERVIAAVASNGTLNIIPSLPSRLAEDANNIIAFVFRGQIVAISIATGLIGLILLREWISQHDWHIRPPLDDEDIKAENWIFRDGQALRVTDSEGELPPIGGDAADGDAETVVADPRDELQNVGELNDESSPVRPAPAHVAFVAPELLGENRGEGSAAGETVQPETGPSRPEAAVPFDVCSRSSSPNGFGLRSEDTGDWADVTDTVNQTSPQGLGPPPATVMNGDHVPMGSKELETIANPQTVPNSTTERARRASDPGPQEDTLHVPSPLTFELQDLAVDMGAIAPSGAPDGMREPAWMLGDEDEAPALDLHPPNPAQAHIGLPRVDTDVEELDTDADVDAEMEAEEAEDDGDVDVEEEQPVAVFEAANRPRLEPAEMDAFGMDMPPDDDDDRPLDADDWDGIFEVVEVIGFIGPLTGLLHNHIFVSLAMACTLTILVGFPVIIGKFVLAPDFVRASGDTFLSTIRSIAFVIDSILDLLVTIVRPVLTLPRAVLPQFEIPIDISGSAANLTTYIFGTPSEATLVAPELPPMMDTAASTVLDGFEYFGRGVHSLYKLFRLSSLATAASPDVVDQLWCLVVGYLSLAIAVICVAVADAAHLLSLSEGIRERAHHIQIFLKVVLFMTLEIVAFPLYVGVLCDLCTLSLLGSTLGDRQARLAAQPFGTLFVAWLEGTVFMFSFATFLQHMRSICRPGALYFIRDPNDPTHSPVRDIMERPASAQILRLAVSAFMYALVVGSICGIIPSTFALLSCISNTAKAFMPLHLEQRPLSSVPFDLLFLHLILPPSWEGLRMYHRLRKALLQWWNFTVAKLELSSLILRMKDKLNVPPPRPYSRVERLTWLVGDGICQALFGRYDNRATLARVPNNDRVELLPLIERRKQGMFIPLDHNGAPKTEADRISLLKQDRAARRGGRNPKQDYTVVSLPDYWRTRVYALVGLALLSASAVAAGIIVFPLIVGRQATAIFFEAPVFDGYSWLMGGYICWGSYSLGQSTKKRIIQWNRAQRLRRSKTSTRFKRFVFQLCRCTYSIVLLYLVLPLLVGINFELFISLPARYGFSNDLTPVLHVWDAWAMGMALISLYVGAVGFVPEDHGNGPDRLGPDLPRGQRFRQAFRRPLKQALIPFSLFIFPLIFYLVAPIMFPWLLFLGLCTGLTLIGVPLPNVDNSWAFRMMYPITSAAMLVWVSWRALSETAKRIKQRMIDAEYVVEERVENYEPAQAEGDVDDIDIGGMLDHYLQGEVGVNEPEDEWEDAVE